MIGSLYLEEENKTKGIKNHFRLKTELNCTAIKDIRNFPSLEKETIAIKDRILIDIQNKIIRDIRNLFEEGDCYKLVRLNNFGSNNYIEYKSKGDKKILSFMKNILIKLNHT